MRSSTLLALFGAVVMITVIAIAGLGTAAFFALRASGIFSWGEGFMASQQTLELVNQQANAEAERQNLAAKRELARAREMRQTQPTQIINNIPSQPAPQVSITAPAPTPMKACEVANNCNLPPNTGEVTRQKRVFDPVDLIIDDTKDTGRVQPRPASYPQPEQVGVLSPAEERILEEIRREGSAQRKHELWMEIIRMGGSGVIAALYGGGDGYYRGVRLPPLYQGRPICGRRYCDDGSWYRPDPVLVQTNKNLGLIDTLEDMLHSRVSRF